MQLYGRFYNREQLCLSFPYLAVGWDELAWELNHNPDWAPGAEKWGKSYSALRRRVHDGTGLCRPHFGSFGKPVWVLPALAWVFDVKERRFRPKGRREGLSLVVERVTVDLLGLRCEGGKHCPTVACGEAYQILNRTGLLIQNADVSGLKLIDGHEGASKKRPRISRKVRQEDRRRGARNHASASPMPL